MSSRILLSTAEGVYSAAGNFQVSVQNNFASWHPQSNRLLLRTIRQNFDCNHRPPLRIEVFVCQLALRFCRQQCVQAMSAAHICVNTVTAVSYVSASLGMRVCFWLLRHIAGSG